MKKTILCISLMLNYFISSAQVLPQKVSLDFAEISQRLNLSKNEKVLGIGNVSNSEITINLPLINGIIADFKMVEYFMIPEGSKTDIKTYYGEKVGDPLVTCRVTLTKDKIMASIIENGQTIIVEKATGSLLSDDYQVYVASDYEHDCGVQTNINKKGKVSAEKGVLNYSYGATLKTFRLALVITSEFYSARGNTDSAVNNEIIAIVNNLNGIYEKEVAVRFTLVTPNNPVSSNFFYKHTGETSTLIGDLFNIQDEVYLRFGSARLDIGHCLHSSGGGVAYLNGVCNNSYKAAALSGGTTSSSVLLLAHEVGHQFNADHTFNGNGSGNCSGINRADNSAYEPGSGNTIMSYAGICSPSSYNLVGGKVPYFHTKSLEDISVYITSSTGSTCGTSSATLNTPPVANAGTAFTIPRNTPFKLIGSGSDSNADALTYTWEQYNLAAVSDSGRLGHRANALGVNAVNSTTAPLFRTSQSTNPVRFFPALQYVLNNANNPADNIGEDLPNVTRTMNFRLTARDNKSGGGGVHCAAIAVTVDAAKGPLSVTSPNSPLTIAAGTSYAVTWDVNSTNLLSPNVKILLSVDGGGSFPFTLSASTPNDGSQSVTIPTNVPASTIARIIVASNNSPTAEFFDASDVNFTITSTCLVQGSYICSETLISSLAGNSALNLGMSFDPANILAGGTKTYSSITTVSRPRIVHTASDLTGCVVLANQSSKLVEIKVLSAGLFNIGASPTSGGSLVFSVYSSNSLSCATFIGSNAFNDGVVFRYSNSDFNLSPCQSYFVIVYTSNAFVLSISGGDVNEVITPPPGFSYTYTAVNQSTNLIADVSPSSNFTGTSAGTYKIYGLMYANGFNTNTLLGKTMEQAYGLGSCILFSNNSKPVTIISNPCATTLTLVSPTDNISSGNVTKVAASAVGGKITASNLVTGVGTRATFTARAIELNQGFLADQGAIFRAEVGGCN